MYENIFRGATRPFRATPDTRFYFPHESIETARRTTLRAVDRAEGPVLVLGGAGLGKSLLGELVANDLAGRFDVVKLRAAGLSSRRALLQNILFELKLPYRELSEGELRLSLLNRLEPSDEFASEGVLLIVDEAHTLPEKLLEELRLITNFTRDNQPRARLVLIGNMQLEDTFASPRLESFNQRLAARCYLSPMTRSQTKEYVEHQIRVAGHQPGELLTLDCQQAVYAASEGLPRLVNQVMDHTLVLAITQRQLPATPAVVEEAWADLQQLPIPWQSKGDRPQASASITSVAAIEFGGLDEDSPSEEWIDRAIVFSDEIGSEEAGQDEAASQLPQFNSTFVFQEERPVNPDVSQSDRHNSQAIPQVAPNFRSDLRPEEQNSRDETEQNNFFAAFTEPDPGEFPEDTRYAEVLSYTKLKDANLPGISGLSLDLDLSDIDIEVPTVLPSDSFFRNRETDERLLALEEETDQFSTISDWQDAALPTSSMTVQPETVHGSKSNSRGPMAENRKHSISIETSSPDRNRLFGDDFEEEMSIDELVQKKHVSPPLPSADSQDSTFEPATEQELLSELEELILQSGVPASVGPWSLDVLAIDAECDASVEQDIEALIAQLNFKGFSDAFSVEQISISAEAMSNSMSQAEDRQPLEDERAGIQFQERSASQQHSGDQQNLFSADWASLDDDRDLLVVDEELARPSGQGEVVTRVSVKKPSYTQLFAKMRK